MLALAHLKKEEEKNEEFQNLAYFGFYHFAKVVEHRNIFWLLEKHAKTTANTRM